MPLQIIVESVPVLAETLARRVEALARAAVARSGRFGMAVPGGSVATTMLPRFATTSIDWSRTDVFFVDERAVPPDDRESNFRVAHGLLVLQGPLAPEKLHRMPAEQADIDAAAHQYEAELERWLGSPPRLDLTLLGMGPDGHVASLFIGRPELEVRDRWAVAVNDSPKPPPTRMTLTVPVLAGADLLVIAAFGPEKATAANDAIANADSDLPAARVLREAPQALVLLDPDAGALVERTSHAEVLKARAREYPGL
jgi:6-phosphogluconolactonase